MRTVTAAVLSMLAISTAVQAAVTVQPAELQARDTWVREHMLAAAPQGNRGVFSFTYGRTPSANLLAAWPQRVEREGLSDGRTRHTLVWTDAASGLVVRCVAVVYADYPAVEWTVYFKNTGKEKTPLLENIQAIDAAFVRDEGGEFMLKHQKGDTCAPDLYQPLEDTLEPNAKLRFAPWGGRGTNGAYPYYNLVHSGGGLFIVVGWPGQWAATFARDAGRALRVVAGQELTHLVLAPGEEIRTPLMALLFWRGADMERAQNLWRHWMLAHNVPRTKDGKLPAPIMPGNTSLEFNEMCDANEENQKWFIDKYVERGIKIDYWWMDAGWYPCNGWPQTGTWEPDLRRFPRGLRAISDQARPKGVKTLVWFEPERVAGGTWLSEKHPEWLLGGVLLYLGNPEARTWLTNHVDRVLTEQGIDLYRQDFNMDPLDFWRRNDAPDRQGVTENFHIQGYLAYWDALRDRHPNLVIDSCASGGRRNDLETMRRAVPLHPTDYNYGHLAAKQAFHQSLFRWIPYFGSNTLPIDTVDPYAIRSGHALSVVLGYDHRRADLDYALLKRLTDETRFVAPYYWGDFYPLAPYSVAEDVWMAWQFNRPEGGDGIVEAFRRTRNRAATATYKLRDLEPDAVYECKDSDKTFTVRGTGRALMDEGLLVTLPQRPQAALITYVRLEGLASVISVAARSCEAGETLAFSGKYSRDAKGTPAGYAWDFGDGAIASGAAATHAYTAAGTYKATLTVKDAQGKADATSVAITVTPVDTTPPAIMSASAGTADKVTVVFSKPVEAASAQVAANYAIDREVRVLSATCADLQTVTLATSPLAKGVEYTLTVNSVKDRARNVHTIAPDSRAKLSFLGLYGWWKLDEGQGDTAFDSSGNGHHGALTGGGGGPAWAQSARGTVLRFGGNGAFVETDTFYPDMAMSFSIALWVHPAAEQVEHADILGNHGEPFLGINLQQEGRRTNCFGFGYGDGKRWQGAGPVQLAADVWQHIAIVCDGQSAVLYLDGVAKSSMAAKGPFAPNPGQNFKLGQGYHSGRYFRGMLSDVRLYRHALSAEEVNALAKK